MTMVVIKWTNRHSNESGYVQGVLAKEKHFVNTFNRNDAKKYSSERIAKGVVTTLIKYGEAENNEFVIEPA